MKPSDFVIALSSEGYKAPMSMMIVLLLFLQKQNLALAVYLFGSVLTLPD